MIHTGPLVPAVFIRRESRFRAVATIESGQVPVHVPNSGRSAELLIPRVTRLVAPADLRRSRRTWATTHMIHHRDGLVCINAHLANALFEDAWRR